MVSGEAVLFGFHCMPKENCSSARRKLVMQNQKENCNSTVRGNQLYPQLLPSPIAMFPRGPAGESEQENARCEIWSLLDHGGGINGCRWTRSMPQTEQQRPE